MGRLSLSVWALSLALLGSCLAEEGYVYFTFTAPKGLKRDELEKAARNAARTLQMRCAAFGYQGIVADTVHMPDDSWLVRLKQPATGFTAEMMDVISALAGIEGRSAEFFVGHTMTDAEAQQFKPPERGTDFSKCPSPKGTRWYPLWDSSPALCLDKPVWDVKGHLVTCDKQYEHWGDFMVPKEATTELVRVAPKGESTIYVLVDKSFVVSVDLEWRDHQYQVQVAAQGHWEHPVPMQPSKDQWVVDVAAHLETVTTRTLEGRWKLTDSQKKALSVCEFSAGWPCSSEEEKKAVSPCAWPLPFSLTMQKSAEKPAEEGK